MVTSILQVRKVKLREIMKLDLGHSAITGRARLQTQVWSVSLIPNLVHVGKNTTGPKWVRAKWKCLQQ